ncbi:MAG: hypothetical protein IJ157_05805 [Clostridia bacterium]|nr:hypothetical protein [Clostridia bacterium]
MQAKKILQWAILAALAAASTLNILYLTGKLGQHAATYGFLLVLACFAAHLLLKRRYADAPVTENNRLQNLRGAVTAAFAVVWLVSTGLAFVWLG